MPTPSSGRRLNDVVVTTLRFAVIAAAVCGAASVSSASSPYSMVSSSSSTSKSSSTIMSPDGGSADDVVASLKQPTLPTQPRYSFLLPLVASVLKWPDPFDDDTDVWTCPSYCDEDGVQYDRVRCTPVTPFCCQQLSGNGLLRLVCCAANESNRIDDDTADDYNCDSLSWATVLGVCVPVGSICFVAVVLLCSYQYRVKLRRRLVIVRRCFGTSSSSSSVDHAHNTSTSSRRPSLCSTASCSSSVTSSSSSTARRQNDDPDGVRTTVVDDSGERRRHRRPPRHDRTSTTDDQQTEVPIFTALYSSSSSSIDGIDALRLVNLTSAAVTTSSSQGREGGGGVGLASGGIYVVEVGLLCPPEPPPYIGDTRLPSYADLYPLATMMTAPSYPT